MTNLVALPQDVVNKIAAGEIIHSPVQVIKELLENSIDANSSAISIIVKNGGLSRINITDDGHGISKDELPKLCQRFNTSKIRCFADLQKLETFGFRGEALASISYVSRLLITSRCENSSVGYRAEFSNGKLVEHSFKPIAANKGTQFTVEDLFYNCLQRKSMLKSPNEEYLKIVRLVQLYSIDRCGISISLKADTGRNFDILTNLNLSKEEKIGKIYGDQLVQSLIKIEQSCTSPPLKYEMYFSNPNFHLKKLEFILFVNGRLVENKALKKAFSDFYGTILLRHTHPFVYLKLGVDPHDIDVNVHPTKSEVLLLNESEIIKHLMSELANKISSSGRSKVFQVLNASQKPPSLMCAPKSSSISSSPVTKVRTSPASPSLLRSFSPKIQRTSTSGSILRRPSVSCELDSVNSILCKIIQNCDLAFKEQVKKICFVGCIDGHNSIFQIETTLYMLNHSALFFDYFSFFILKNLSCLPIIELESSKYVDISALDSCKFRPLLSKSDILDAREMLEDYFSLRITDDGLVTGLPILLQNFPLEYFDAKSFMVSFMSYSTINWDDEEECLFSIAKSLSHAFSAAVISRLTDTLAFDQIGREYFEVHLVPLLRDGNYFYPSKSGITTTSSLNRLADLKELYKIFERC
ncbi:DNA mismatch repair protein [Mitosporidium daphniae]